MIGLDLLLFDHGGRPAGRRLRVVRAAFIGLLAVVPVVLFAFVARRAAAVRRLPVVPCTILSSGVDVDEVGTDRSSVYKPMLLFQFTLDGVPHLGHRPAVNDPGGTVDAAAAYSRAAAHPEGSAAACYVDPADPDDAVLVTPPRAWEPWAIPVSVAVAAIVLLAYSLPEWIQAASPAAAAEVAAFRQRPGYRRRTSALWGLATVAGFGAAVWFGWAVPIGRALAARRWPAVPCVVEASRVQRHREAGEVPLTLYRTDVLYRYEVGGRTYHLNVYNPTETTSPFAAGRAGVVADYPPGRATTCRVDPADPAAATLTVGVSPTAAVAVVPALLAVAGLAVVGSAIAPRGGGAVPSRHRLVRWASVAIVLLAAAATTWGFAARP